MNCTRTKHVCKNCKKRVCFHCKLLEIECQPNLLIRLRLIYWTMRNRCYQRRLSIVFQIFHWMAAPNFGYVWSNTSETCLRLRNLSMLLIIAVSMAIAHIIYWPIFTSASMCVRVCVFVLDTYRCGMDYISTPCFYYCYVCLWNA